MCETRPGRWNAPESAEHPEAAISEVAALERRLDELEHGRITPALLHAQMLSMCAMCQEIVIDVRRATENPQVERRLRFRIERLRDVGACADRAG